MKHEKHETNEATKTRTQLGKNKEHMKTVEKQHTINKCLQESKSKHVFRFSSFNKSSLGLYRKYKVK